MSTGWWCPAASECYTHSWACLNSPEDWYGFQQKLWSLAFWTLRGLFNCFVKLFISECLAFGQRLNTRLPHLGQRPALWSSWLEGLLRCSFPSSSWLQLPEFRCAQAADSSWLLCSWVLEDRECYWFPKSHPWVGYTYYGCWQRYKSYSNSLASTWVFLSFRSDLVWNRSPCMSWVCSHRLGFHTTYSTGHRCSISHLSYCPWYWRSWCWAVSQPGIPLVEVPLCWHLLQHNLEILHHLQGSCLELWSLTRSDSFALMFYCSYSIRVEGSSCLTLKLLLPVLQPCCSLHSLELSITLAWSQYFDLFYPYHRRIGPHNDRTCSDLLNRTASINSICFAFSYWRSLQSACRQIHGAAQLLWSSKDCWLHLPHLEGSALGLAAGSWC